MSKPSHVIPAPASVAKPSGKTRINLRIDSDVLAHYRRRAGPEGKYQELISRDLRALMSDGRGPWVSILRQIVREELRAVGLGRSKPAQKQSRKSDHGGRKDEQK